MQKGLKSDFVFYLFVKLIWLFAIEENFLELPVANDSVSILVMLVDYFIDILFWYASTEFLHG